MDSVEEKEIRFSDICASLRAIFMDTAEYNMNLLLLPDMSKAEKEKLTQALELAEAEKTKLIAEYRQLYVELDKKAEFEYWYGKDPE